MCYIEMRDVYKRQVTHSNHVGTHLDGPLHFDTAGRDIASLELTKLCAPGVVVDISDMGQDFGIYTPKDLMDRAEIRKGDILIINTGIAAKEMGVGQVGAGLVSPPMKCFEDALEACAAWAQEA